MPKAIQVNYEKIFSKLRKLNGHKKDEYKRKKDSYLLTFSTHRENKPFEVVAEPRRLHAKCMTSNGNKTSLPGAVAVLKSLFAKGPYCHRMSTQKQRLRFQIDWRQKRAHYSV